MKPLNELSASEAAAEIAAGRLTSERLVSACLERIERREPEVLAWAHLDPELALAQARACDRGPSRGPLHGVPVGVKDIIDTADQPTACGSPIYEGHRPRADAACVALVRRAGGVILGKTVSTEFAFSTPNKTRNPHNPAHTPGGSSSGSAAAVADRMVPLAFGTQTGGSVIRPASFCGVVGYKASFDGLQASGVKVLAQSLDTLGVMARSVADACLMRAVQMGAPSKPAPRTAAPRLGLCRTPQWDSASAESRAALEAAGKALGAEPVELPGEFGDLIAAHRTVMNFEAARNLAWERAERGELLSPKLRDTIDEAFAAPFARYREARELVASCRPKLAEVFRRFDALVAPSAVGEAPRSLETTGDPLFNSMWTFLGNPCVTLPGCKGPNGLPVGVQLVGALGADDELLAVAAWAESRIA
jgi:amidase